jgi:CO/xanthine dehydrogenase Mo-binding subunit
MIEYSVVGKPLPRVDGIAKLTGKAKYTTDIILPHMVYGKLLRSSHPHARIIR